MINVEANAAHCRMTNTIIIMVVTKRSMKSTLDEARKFSYQRYVTSLFGVVLAFLLRARVGNTRCKSTSSGNAGPHARNK